MEVLESAGYRVLLPKANLCCARPLYDWGMLDRARRLSQQTFLLSEFLVKKTNHFQLPKLPRKALVHGHCHHKSVMRMTDEEAVLRKMGIDFQTPAPGCCGMAGSFGFERDKYEISVAIGELELLPAVRKASPDCLIIADGFSCREQIAQRTNRHALHLAEIIQMAARDGSDRVRAMHT